MAVSFHRRRAVGRRFEDELEEAASVSVPVKLTLIPSTAGVPPREKGKRLIQIQLSDCIDREWL